MRALSNALMQKFKNVNIQELALNDEENASRT
jgi:hypothetical protein